MKIRRSDYALVRIAELAWPALQVMGNVETEFLRRQLATIEVRQPVFVTGLARAGTTILLQELEATNQFATHRYRDFPFLSLPVTWNRFVDWMGTTSKPTERPHRDRIQITSHSPEAFEEPLWQHFFPHVHGRQKSHCLDAETMHPVFESFYRDHLRKILLIRGCERYLSKGNYHITRLEYLSKLFPDARFVIPVRHPVDHVASLVRQHRLFSEYARQDCRIAKYLAAAGHFEFGPQREPIWLTRASHSETLTAWENGNDHEGYAIQWSAVYSWVREAQQRPSLESKLLIVRHEDLCQEPKRELDRIHHHIALDVERHLRDTGQIDKECVQTNDGITRYESDRIWEITATVATSYGYVPKNVSEWGSSEPEASASGGSGYRAFSDGIGDDPVRARIVNDQIDQPAHLV